MIGEILRNRREELGIDLKEAAHGLRIQYEYLKALENDNLDKLPPAVYTRGYIREYARLLGVNPGPLLDEYGGLEEDEGNTEPELPDRKRIPLTRPSLLIPLIIALVFVAVVISTRGRGPLEEPSGGSANTVSGADLQPGSSPESSVSRDQISSLPSSTGNGHVLNMVASEATWLHIGLGNGKSEEVLMKPGESKTWTSPDGFDLKLGNAGGVMLIFDGKVLGVPGERGQVLRLKLPRGVAAQQSPG